MLIGNNLPHQTSVGLSNFKERKSVLKPKNLKTLLRTFCSSRNICHVANVFHIGWKEIKIVKWRVLLWPWTSSCCGYYGADLGWLFSTRSPRQNHLGGLIPWLSFPLIRFGWVWGSACLTRSRCNCGFRAHSVGATDWGACFQDFFLNYSPNSIK